MLCHYSLLPSSASCCTSKTKVAASVMTPQSRSRPTPPTWACTSLALTRKRVQGFSKFFGRWLSLAKIALRSERRALSPDSFLRYACSKVLLKCSPRKQKKSTKPGLSPFFLFLLSSFPSYSQLSFAPIPIENLRFYMKW